jgi:hypothetical protein
MPRKSDSLNLAELGLDEAEVLAWIEGESDDGADERMQRLLKAAPVLAARQIIAMRRDSILLNGQRVETAPDDLVASALSRAETDLERDLLVGLSDGEPIPFGLPKVKVGHSVGAIADLIFNSVVGRVAIAAGLLVSAGTAVYLGIGSLEQQAAEPTHTGLALNDANAELDEEAPIDPGAPATELGAADTNNALQMTDASEPEVEQLPLAEPMALARAIELSGERRLLVRVRTMSLTDTTRRLGAIAGENRRVGAWSLSSRVSNEMLAALDAPAPRRDRTPSDRAGEPAFADDGGPPAPVDRTELEPLPPIPELRPPVYIASVRANETSLDDLLAAITRGAVTGIELVELDEPLPATTPALTRDAVLWWTRPPEEWLPRTDVPIVVQAAD